MFFDSSGNLLVNLNASGGGGAATTPTSSNVALTSVPAATANTALLAANPARKGAYITNNGSANMYLAYGPTASLTAFTVKIAPGGFFELPTTPVWQGAVSAIWDAANGNAQVTEVS